MKRLRIRAGLSSRVYEKIARKPASYRVISALQTRSHMAPTHAFDHNAHRVIRCRGYFRTPRDHRKLRSRSSLFRKSRPRLPLSCRRSHYLVGNRVSIKIVYCEKWKFWWLSFFRKRTTRYNFNNNQNNNNQNNKDKSRGIRKRCEKCTQQKYFNI